MQDFCSELFRFRPDTVEFIQSVENPDHLVCNDLSLTTASSKVSSFLQKQKRM
jgi:hypothetical protein